MNRHNDFFYLGIITKLFGYKGDMFIYLDTDEPEKYSQLAALFVQDADGGLLPYMIERLQYRNDNFAIVKLRGVDGEEAKLLLKSEIYLPVSLLPPLTGNNFYYHEVIGFQVVDKKMGNIGVITDFIDISKQPIMQIDYNGKEILIPAIDRFFDHVDREQKIIFIEAPDGLIDIYLEI
ncbi:MAG: ribosome maturation factor RimM [Bacteroidales bacterium]|jgi:16S rRNA processing protein RimM|nr:ribosome maturation factor RimM [Bacteroidales bacterium]